MKAVAAIAGGLAGTVAVASVHETFKRIRSDAPRIDRLNGALIQKSLRSMHQPIPSKNALQRWEAALELGCDVVYYSLAAVGDKKGVWLRGPLLGLVAGLTAVVLPKPLGLPSEPTNKTVGTQLMTIGLYVIGGLAAAAIGRLVEEAAKKDDEPEEATASIF